MTPQQNGRIRKTIYINKHYMDVVKFFEQENSSKIICELIRAEMKKDKTNEPVLSETELMLKEIHSFIKEQQGNEIFDLGNGE